MVELPPRTRRKFYSGQTSIPVRPPSLKRRTPRARPVGLFANESGGSTPWTRPIKKHRPLQRPSARRSRITVAKRRMSKQADAPQQIGPSELARRSHSEVQWCTTLHTLPSADAHASSRLPLTCASVCTCERFWEDSPEHCVLFLKGRE
jgi:hypothetical protein